MARPVREGDWQPEKLRGLLDAAPAATKHDGQRQETATGLPRGHWAARGVYRVERELPYGKTYGARAFEDPRARSRLLGAWGAHDMPVFLDLETTGLSGGAGTYAFMAGLGICGDRALKIIQLFLTDPCWEDNWLLALESELPPEFGLVTYNGACFDLPLLRTRCALARRTPGWYSAPHIDMLLLARHFYRKRLPACSLSTVETHVLGVGRSGEDIPGREIPAMYGRFLRTRDAAELSGVFYHNRLDIASLAALMSKIAALVDGGGSCGEDWLRCGDLWYIMGRGEDAQAAWHRAMEYEDGVCGASLRLAEKSRRGGDFEDAKKHFEQALAYDLHPLETLENLAKLEEHRFHNYEAALGHAEHMLEWLNSRRSLRDYKWSLQRQDVLRRIERLKRKIAASGEK